MAQIRMEKIPAIKNRKKRKKSGQRRKRAERQTTFISFHCGYTVRRQEARHHE